MSVLCDVTIRSVMKRWKEMLESFRNALTMNWLIAKGIKYIPLVCAALLCAHVAVLLCGETETVSVCIATALMLVLIVLLSIKFKFCLLHKLLIIFVVAMIACVGVQKSEGFGLSLTIARVVTLVCGIALISKATVKGIDDGDYE